MKRLAVVVVLLVLALLLAALDPMLSPATSTSRGTAQDSRIFASAFEPRTFEATTPHRH